MTPRRTGRRSLVPVWIVLAVIGWGGVGWIAAGLLASDPPRAGFDLALLLDAGGDVAAGRSPYAPSILAGDAPDATDLFYSYPPPVGQAAALVHRVPVVVALGALAAVAVTGLVAVVVALAGAVGSAASRTSVGWATLALAPLILPFSIALVFGNLDALFPLAYGAALLAALGIPRWRVGGGIAVALATTAKIYPAALGLWFVLRALRPGSGARQANARVVVAVAAATAIVVVAVSLAVGGLSAWTEYATAIRVVAGAPTVDPRNASPAAQLAIAGGGGEAIAAGARIAVTLGAVLATVWAAWRRDDPVESLAVAAAASLAILPITWYHYPAALIPFGAAAVLRDQSGTTVALVALAGLALVLALVIPALLWLAVGLVVLAASRSRLPHRAGALVPLAAR